MRLLLILDKVSFSSHMSTVVDWFGPEGSEDRLMNFKMSDIICKVDDASCNVSDRWLRKLSYPATVE